MRNLMKGAFTAAAALALTAAVSAPSFAASSAGPNFTAAQQAAGSKQFEQSCAACHGSHLEGGAGPALTGATFKTLSDKVHANVSDIFTYMTTNMPLNEPASLSHAQYVEILSFILSKNGYRPTGKPLTFSAASSSKASIIHR